MQKNETSKEPRALKLIGKIAVILFWIALVLLCLLCRDRITVEGLVELVPKNSVISVIVMLSLFAIKGVTVFLYGGILYAASGILFSLPVAILVNTAGTVLMTTIPFFIGKKAGTRMIDKLLKKNPKLGLLRDVQNKNEWVVSIFLRTVGILPADLVAMYLGASGMRFRPYLVGSLIGLFPSILCFSIMGMSIDDVGSPQFMISAVVEIGLMLLSLGLYFFWRRKNQKRRLREEIRHEGKR